MNPEHFRSLILERLAALDADDEAGKQGQAIVKLDQTSVGRLSRMDALQHQAMAQATARRREVERMRLNAALDRIEDDEFGFCTDCGEELPLARLEQDPGYQGQSLLPLVFDGFFPSRSIYASTVGVANGVGDDEPLKPMTSLVRMPYKVMHDKVSGHLELYDLENDPEEMVDLAGTRPLLAQQMFQALLLQEQANNALNTGADDSGGPEEAMDPELVERLRSLGYIQ